MATPIRFTGLAVFVTIIGLIALFNVLFLDSIITKGIRTGAAQTTGATVDLDAARLSFSEQRLSLSGLAVANPQDLMTNLFQADELTMDIDASALTWNKIIIDEVTATNLLLNSPRTKAGKVTERWLDTGWDPMGQLSSFTDISSADLPDPNKLIAEQGLQTPRAVESFKTRLADTEKQLKTSLADLPDEADIKAFEDRLNKIISDSKGKNKLLGLLSGGKDLKELRRDVKAELDKIKSVKTQLAESRKTLSEDLKALKSMPKQDLQRLKSKYSLSGDGVNQIVSSVFGPQIGEWTQQAWRYYQMAAPYLDKYQSSGDEEGVKVAQQISSRGRQVLFADENPLPQYLVKQILISSAETDQGIGLSGEISNLTTEPGRWGQPLTFDLQGAASFLSRLLLMGTLDHRTPGSSNDQIRLKAEGVKLVEVASGIEQSAFNILDGKLAVDADINLQETNLNATVKMQFSGTRITADTANSWQKMMVDGINGMPKFRVEMKITGSINEPKIDFSSPDLSNLGKAIVTNLASDKIAGFERQLQDTINNQTKGLLDGLPDLGSIANFEQQLNLKEVNLNDLLRKGG